MGSAISAQQRARQKVGQTFEQLLAAHHEEARARGLLAWWRHVSPAMRTLRRPGEHGKWQVRHVITGEACADFVGQLHSAIALVVESKSHDAAAGDFPLRKIEDQQRAQLDACAAAGGLALLAIEWRGPGGAATVRTVIPWQQVPWRVKRTAQTVSLAAVAAWAIDTACYLTRFVVPSEPFAACAQVVREHGEAR